MIRIGLKSLRGEHDIAGLCRREGIHPDTYFDWSKEFIEAGKKRLTGDAHRQTDSRNVQAIRAENELLKQRAPDPATVADWPGLLNQFDAREILHVTFGSVLTAEDGAGGRLFHDRLMQALRRHAEAYAGMLEAHFLRHLRPFAGKEGG